MESDAVVHVIDDDDAVRESLAFLLKTARIAVKTYDSAAAFLGASPPITSGCVITDVRMPGISGIELLQRLRERNVGVPVIVITGHGDVPLAVRAMKAGAIDFIEKPFASKAILDSLAAGFARLATPTGQDPAASKLNLLSSREREVLEGLLAGLPNKSIAYDLGISPRTVEIHRARVMDKMGARSLSELIRLALVGGVQPTPQ